MNYKALGLQTPKKAPSFCGLILKNYDEYSKDRKRPAVLVLPGGGYEFTSQREATPVALEFAAAGISVFVLHYSTAPDVFFPTELVQVFSAIRVIRENAVQWNIDPEQIYLCGFSAGGHLAASAGVFWNRDWVHKLGFEGYAHKPNGLILNYPVITSGELPIAARLKTCWVTSIPKNCWNLTRWKNRSAKIHLAASSGILLRMTQSRYKIR